MGGGGIQWCTAIPWAVAFAYFAFKNPDPEHCWVVPGDLKVYAEDPMEFGSRDMAQDFRFWMKLVFIIYCVLWTFACCMLVPQIGMIAGAVTGEGPLILVCAVLNCCCGLALCGSCLTKCAFYWWGFALRVREEGRVAVGKMAE